MPLNGQLDLGANIANALKVRQNRDAYMAENPGDTTALTNSIHSLGDNWDAFFGGLQQQQENAADAGMKFKVGLGGFGNLPASLQALTQIRM